MYFRARGQRDHGFLLPTQLCFSGSCEDIFAAFKISLFLVSKLPPSAFIFFNIHQPPNSYLKLLSKVLNPTYQAGPRELPIYRPLNGDTEDR